MFEVTSPATESLRFGRFFNHLFCSNTGHQREPGFLAIRCMPLLDGPLTRSTFDHALPRKANGSIFGHICELKLRTIASASSTIR